MALYRGMDVGTAKPNADQRRRVPHHLIDVLDPWESASVAWWLGRAAECVRDIESRGRRALLVGGTPLYLKALLHGLFDGPPADEELRLRLTEQAAREGAPALHARLTEVDPPSAERLHPNDVRRVVRALEVWELTGRRMSEWQTQWPGVRGPNAVLLPPDSGPLTPAVWLDLPRDELYARIDARVLAMIRGGFVDEVRGLRRQPRPLGREARQALGYKEMFDHLDGKTSLEETVKLIQTRSRQFAKRQITWFRSMPAVRPASRELTFRLWGLTMETDQGER